LGEDAAIPQAAWLESSGLMQRRSNGKTPSNDNGTDNSAAPKKGGIYNPPFSLPATAAGNNRIIQSKHRAGIGCSMASAISGA